MDVVGFLVSWITLFSIYSILSISLNLEAGYTGISNFGKAAFYGIGAFFAAVISLSAFLMLNGLSYPLYSLETIISMGTLSKQNPILSILIFLFTVVLAFFVSGIAGYMVSYPTLRVGPAFLGITVLSFGELLRIFLRNFQPTGGTYGLAGIPHPFAFIQDPAVKDFMFMLVTLVILAIMYIFSEKFVNSPYGRIMKSIREDEIASLCLGKDVPKIKAQVLFIGSGMAGVAGALLAYYMGSINPDIFVPSLTFEVWAMVILGGLANNKGALLGAGIITFLNRASVILNFTFQNLPIDVNYIRWMIVGLLIVASLLFKPEGLIPEDPKSSFIWNFVEEKEPISLKKRMEETSKKVKFYIKKVFDWFAMGGG
ncbi:MAG: branched-chain amino acid ABC transporter permease [Thermoproteota archaeon]|nr:branched-chain amino acid ABC transporter permease [Candidatus Brockarchaeota archaeon]MBO3762615.1 branched-chain amino acid ABC transporter permease [Candidatus Brockarchaeota archaeon]MBO3768374.1 branched-chain amino acid ABC transporter permease [Candidatus Brockarchaeota archaeon]MBO3800776.1 branched-chain amino acid ABC transporter permease [Candidatus Brockarchaeota archaeon]